MTFSIESGEKDIKERTETRCCLYFPRKGNRETGQKLYHLVSMEEKRGKKGKIHFEMEKSEAAAYSVDNCQLIINN